MISWESKPAMTSKPPCSASGWLQNSFAATERHHQQAIEGHGIVYLSFARAGSGTSTEQNISCNFSESLPIESYLQFEEI